MQATAKLAAGVAHTARHHVQVDWSAIDGLWLCSTHRPHGRCRRLISGDLRATSALTVAMLPLPCRRLLFAPSIDPAAGWHHVQRALPKVEASDGAAAAIPARCAVGDSERGALARGSPDPSNQLQRVTIGRCPGAASASASLDANLRHRSLKLGRLRSTSENIGFPMTRAHPRALQRNRASRAGCPGVRPVGL